MNDEKKDPRRRFGSLFRQRNGRWLARYPDPSGNLNARGRVRVISRTLPTKRAGQAFLREMERAVLAGGGEEAEAPPPSEPVPTVAQAVRAFIEQRRMEGAAKSTLAGMVARERALNRHELAETPVDDVTVDDLLKYFDWRRTAKYYANPLKKGYRVRRRKGGECSRGTLGLDRALLSGAFTRLVKRGILDRSPVHDIPVFRGRTKEIVYLSESEAARLLDACDSRLRPMIVAGLLTGARRGELADLRWRDVDFGKNLITIHRSKTRNASHVPLHPDLAAALERLLSERQAEGRIVPPTERIFLSPTGKRWTAIDKLWKKAVEGAGLGDRPDMKFHVLRHSFSTLYLSKGGTIDSLRRILGHSNLTTTMRYLHLVQGDAERGIAALDFGIGGEEGEVHARTA